MPTDSHDPASARLDVWLWSVRLFKTRSSATQGCRAGHVRLNGAPVKAAQPVRVGDRVSVKRPGWLQEFEVTRLIVKRVGAPVAVKCYIDHSPPRPAELSVPVARRDRGAGRPTKRDRRELERLWGER
ncbi:RNA-binding S4 domain-containing protein [Kocuria tytonis]|uniref:RNA-binding S4 domain-containing protein n=1 Tax=Kocuria tytonis TaxID=2054280 RepID=A0A495A777_9MICC|nr:RNA-binding S4 domain-containing protein [Kocuria tytonis]RKQ35106.1 RNA-binding S4 domain-containing protein [Kocuria tytonis]